MYRSTLRHTYLYPRRTERGILGLNIKLAKDKYILMPFFKPKENFHYVANKPWLLEAPSLPCALAELCSRSAGTLSICTSSVLLAVTASNLPFQSISSDLC